MNGRDCDGACVQWLCGRTVWYLARPRRGDRLRVDPVLAGLLQLFKGTVHHFVDVRETEDTHGR